MLRKKTRHSVSYAGLHISVVLSITICIRECSVVIFLSYSMFHFPHSVIVMDQVSKVMVT